MELKHTHSLKQIWLNNRNVFLSIVLALVFSAICIGVGIIFKEPYTGVIIPLIGGMGILIVGWFFYVADAKFDVYASWTICGVILCVVGIVTYNVIKF